jgi:hypothetical protein
MTTHIRDDVPENDDGIGVACSPVAVTLLPRPYRKQSWNYNRCEHCGRFRSWEKLTLHFVPDTAFSSESESWRECDECRKRK